MNTTRNLTTGTSVALLIHGQRINDAVVDFTEDGGIYYHRAGNGARGFVAWGCLVEVR